MPVSSSLPGPERAAAAAAHVGPALERDLAARGLTLGAPVFLRAFKRERQLEVFVRRAANGRFELFRTYPIAAASGGPGPKRLEGDLQVPEGFYQVDRAAMKPDSRFHLAFNIGYPNAFDRAHGRTGTAIMVHGNQASIGCLAMTDVRIEEIYTLCDAALQGGQPFFQIHLFPFRMTAGNLAEAADNPNHPFWENLAEGNTRFERSGNPPAVSVRAGRYFFGP